MISNLKICLTGSLFAAILLGSINPAEAQEDQWSFSVTPFGWAMSLNGDAVVNGTPADVDVGFDTIIENLDIGAMVDMRARRGKFGLFGNLVYGKVGASETASLGLAPIDIRVAAKLTFFEFGATYAFDPIPLGDPSPAGHAATVSFEPYVGGRYSDIDFDASIGPFEGSADMTWVEPLIGLRTNWDISDRWRALASGDIGGFGVGSDFSWQAMALAGYDFGMFGERDGTAFFGYRALGQDYAEGSGASRKEWDVIVHGPIVGVSVRF